MVNQPDQGTHGGMLGVKTPTNKLVLPAPADEGPYRQRPRPHRPESPRSQQLSSAPSGGLFTRLFHLMRKEPAYAVLALGIALVILSSIVFLALGANLLVNNNNGVVWTSSQTQHPAAPTPAGTVDNKPSFPTPVTGKGTNQSSQPPATGPTPSLQPSPSPTSTDQGTLSVEIVNTPNVVNNGSRQDVEVETSEPDVNLRLQVTYTAAPFFASSSGRTNGNGEGTIIWNIKVHSLLNTNTQATLVVTATDRDGQQATSQTVTVMIAG